MQYMFKVCPLKVTAQEYA